MPMRRIDSDGLTSPGMPGWKRPMTPRFRSPVRSNMMSALLPLSFILSHGTSGRPRHVRNDAPNSVVVGGGTPRRVHSRPNAAIAFGCMRKKAGSFHTVLISTVWKEPAFFLMHPKAIAAFGRECTRRGVPPPTTTLFGASFLTWRGLPLVPCDKMKLKGNKADIMLLRTGERKRGVIGLFQPGIPGEVSPSLSIRLMGINQQGVASYLLSLYCSAAVLTHDALGVLEGVTIDHFYDYA